MDRNLLKELIQWKNKKDHFPLLLRGARQVGKSYLVEHFGKTHFQNTLTIDFERRPHLAQYFNVREPKEIIHQLEVAFQQPIHPGSTLLFLDEIQHCPEALITLRYFRELIPKLHVIAAGSLMEFILNDTAYSFPVGRVEFLYLRPLSFAEYLKASAPLAYQALEKIDFEHPCLPPIHNELLKWVRKYLFIGGMPFAITTSLNNDSLLECQRVHERILQAYTNDFGKYAKNTQHKYLQTIFQRSPALVGQILKYTRLDPDARSRDLKPALELLGCAGLLQQVFATTASGLPLYAHCKESRFKLLYLDVGMLQTAAQVDAQSFWIADVLQINQGMIAEQFVGQELLAYSDPYHNRPLLFWESEQGGQSEIDYLITVDTAIIPIEVKAGLTGRLRSLQNFLQLKKIPFGIRISEHPLSFYGNILSIPLYLMHTIPTLVRAALLDFSH